MIKDIVILGSSGLAKETLFLLERNNEKEVRWNILGFIDNDLDNSQKICGYPVLGNDDWLIEYGKEICAACAVGNSNLRKKITDKFTGSKHISFPTLIDNSVIISKHVQLGEGCILYAGSIFTVDIIVKDFTIINLACTIGHDVEIEEFTTVNPGTNISGNVKIKKFCNIGTGSKLIQGITIGEKTIIGAGSVVIRNIPDNVTAVGNPTRILEKENK